jgi:hypothetical protein
MFLSILSKDEMMISESVDSHSLMIWNVFDNSSKFIPESFSVAGVSGPF